MTKSRKPITILMADDDADDRLLTKEAFDASHLANELRFVEDGVELLDYLYRRNKYSSPDSSPRPSIDSLFSDVFKTRTPALIDQQAELEALVREGYGPPAH